MATKRKDSHRIVLKKGEYQRTNGTYAYRWTDGKGKRHEVYARDLDDLRAKEKEIDADTNDELILIIGKAPYRKGRRYERNRDDAR